MIPLLLESSLLLAREKKDGKCSEVGTFILCKNRFVQLKELFVKNASHNAIQGAKQNFVPL